MFIYHVQNIFLRYSLFPLYLNCVHNFLFHILSESEGTLMANSMRFSGTATDSSDHTDEYANCNVSTTITHILIYYHGRQVPHFILFLYFCLYFLL